MARLRRPSIETDTAVGHLIIMSFSNGAAGLTVAWLLAVATPASAGQDPQPRPQSQGALPISLSRIREALKKPDRLRGLLAPPQADFSVQVLEKQRFADLLSLIDFGSGPVAPGGWYAHQQRQVIGQQQSQPLVNVDLMAIGTSVGKALSQARRDRAERLARDEVRRALVDFCAERECSSR